VKSAYVRFHYFTGEDDVAVVALDVGADPVLLFHVAGKLLFLWERGGANRAGVFRGAELAGNHRFLAPLS
jgi:hypothetical protein